LAFAGFGKIERKVLFWLYSLIPTSDGHAAEDSDK